MLRFALTPVGPRVPPLVFLVVWCELVGAWQGHPESAGEVVLRSLPLGLSPGHAVCSGDVSGIEEHSVSFSVLTVPCAEGAAQ